LVEKVGKKNILYSSFFIQPFCAGKKVAKTSLPALTKGSFKREIL